MGFLESSAEPEATRALARETREEGGSAAELLIEDAREPRRRSAEATLGEEVEVEKEEEKATTATLVECVGTATRRAATAAAFFSVLYTKFF